MSPRSIVLIIKQFRFELAVVVTVLLGVAALELIVVAALPGLQSAVVAASCGYSDECQRLITIGGILQNAGNVLPPVASFIGGFGAIVLGVAVVGREVERGTATLAWPLARSRRRWLAQRVVVIGTILVLAAGAASLAADLLVPVLRPDLRADTAFIGFETRGLLPVGRILVAFAVGVLAGAAFGRVLPGLLLAIAILAVGYWGVAVANGAWRARDAVVMESQLYDVDLVMDSRLRDASGRLFTWSEAYDRDQSPSNGSVPDGWPDAFYQQVTIGLPGDRRPGIDQREAALFAALAVLMIGASVVAVERRRPY